MLFTRKSAASPAKILRLVSKQDWRQGEALRITPRPQGAGPAAGKRLVLRREGLGELALTPMRWGLRVDTRDVITLSDLEPVRPAAARPLTAIRSDSIRTQAHWRMLLNYQRCIIPAEQFYEWKREGELKTREYCIRMASGRPMLMAGLWNKADGFGDTFAYISCAANPLVEFLHDQMPVMLDEASVATWLNPDTTLETLISLLRPAKVEAIEIQPVQPSAQKPNATQRPNQLSLFDRRAA